MAKTVARKSAAPTLAAVGLSALLGLFVVSCGGGGGGGSGGTAPPPPPAKFNSSALPLNASFVVRFTAADTVGYHCIPHRSVGMTGTVRVNTASANDSTIVDVGPGNTNTFNPAIVTIRPGPNNYVRWRNVSSSTIHTVTQD